MVVTYNDEVLRLVVSQICQNVGWNGIGNQSLDILKEVCRKYIQEIGKVTSAVCNHYNRTEPNLDDLAIAFKQFDISIPELEDYYGNVDAVQFAKGEVPRIPVPNARGCSRITFTDETEIQTRAEYYHEWLPSLQTVVDTTIREGLESVTLNETEEPASELAAAKRAQGKREDAIGAVKTAPSLKVSGFSELEATQPTSVYIASNGQIVGVNGREGRHPEAKLPPKDYDEEDLFDRVCRGHYDKQHSFNDVTDEQRVREKQIPSPLKLKLKDKKRLKKNKENSSAKSAADSKSKELIVKKIKKERKEKKDKKSFGSLSIKVSGLTSGTPTATPSPAMTKSPKSDEGNHDYPDQSFSLRNFIEDNHHKAMSINDISVDECISAVIARAAEEENEVVKKKEEKSEEKKKSKDKDKEKKKEKKEKKMKKKKGQLVEETIDDVIKTAMVKEETVPIIPKDIYNFNDDASNSSVNDVLKLSSPPANRSQDDDKEAAKILVSLSEEKKAKKSSPKKSANTSNSVQPNSTKQQQNTNSFQTSFSSNSFPKVSPGTTPLSPTGNLFNPFSNLSTGTPISSVPTPPLFTKGEPAAYPKPPVLFKPSTFSPVNRSDSGFESSTNIYGHGAHFENNSLNSGIIPPKPPIKTLAEKKALPDITLPLSVPKKERKDKRKKEKNIRDDKKEKVKKSKKLDVSEEFSDEEVKDEEVVLPKLTVKISGGTSSATPSPSSTASSTKIVIQGETPPISPGIKKDKKVLDDKDKKDKKKRKNSLREKAICKTITDAASCTVITETISTGENGGKLWICPACKTPDDGTPMIGCDECDDWYHWVCVGIKVPPKDEDSWFCDRCIAKQQKIVHTMENKKSRDKRLKDNKRHCDHDNDHVDEIEESIPESVKTPLLVPKLQKPKTSTGKGRGRPPKNPPLISRLVEDNEQEDKVWVCPQCEKEDDGTPMIGCDGCEDWYHWICVGIIVKPKAEEVWLCPRCKKKKKTATASKVK